MRLTKKESRVMAFLLLLLVITVGYALLSQTLDINGTSKIKKTTWSIIWDNVEVNSNSVSGTSVTQAAQITNTEKTLVEYSITLSEPGEFYEFTVDAKNEGTIDGMVNTVSNKVYESNGTTEKTLPAYLTYSVTYSDGKAIAPKQLLKAGTTEKYKVRVEFKDVEASLLPAQEETIKFKFSVDYVQADDSAQAVTHALTGTRYTTNLYEEDSEGNWIEDSSVWIGRKPTDNITLYEIAAEAKTAFSNRPYYLKHEIENDIVKDSYVCFEKDSKTYCLRGQQTYEKVNGSWQCKSEFLDSVTNTCLSTYYESNKAILLEAFGSANCTDDSPYFGCSVPGLNADASEDGDVDASDGSSSCDFGSSGSSSCAE